MTDLKPVIGLEIHVELKTDSKMFCGCPADHFGKTPNSQTCPVCLGLPGALPVPNQKAIDWTMLLGMALHSSISGKSKFDRKHYFYPDLPKGFQISQYDEPFCQGGFIETSLGRFNLTRIHLEEDTGKLQHINLNGEKVTLVDFNRSGVPLVEIVSEPEINSPAQAKAYAQAIRLLVIFLGISDADMEKGTLRLEANISYGLHLGYKVEIKNINSFRFLEKAIQYELDRQINILKAGKTPTQETRGYDAAKGVTFSQRSKETSADYRYFPEPDIPPYDFPLQYLKNIRACLPKLPAEYYKILTEKYQLRPDTIVNLVTSPVSAENTLSLLDHAQKDGLNPQKVAGLIINKKLSLKPFDIDKLLNKAHILLSRPSTDSVNLNGWIQSTLNSNPDLVNKYKLGKTTVIGVLIGEVLKLSRGQADPVSIRKSLLKELDK